MRLVYLALAALLCTASVAVAAEVTRDTYREEADPICKRNTEANERIFKGVRAEVKAGKLKPAAKQFAKAATALERTVRELKALPQPSADTARLGKWLAAVEEEAGYFRRVSSLLKAGKKSQAQKTVVRLTSNAQKANNIVIAFEFHYCRLEPSRFT